MKLSRMEINWGNLSLGGKIVMAVMLPVFALVAGLEHLIARLTGATYNEVNNIVYYLLIPLSWAAMIDYIARLPFLSLLIITTWIIFLWKNTMIFRNRCDWAFMKSVDFLLWFKRIGWSYVVSSVIICVVIPILIYVELIYAVQKL